MELVGRKVGPYEILEEIGRGGMGVVFKARHEKLSRLVALKMLAPHLAGSPTMRARFLREAQLQAGLLHPNVVNIFDYLEEGGNVFLVMEYVPGQTLEEMLLKKGRFSVAEVLYVAEGVLEALAFMHQKGVIHRDIKPSNIMVAENGLIKVTDFGIARLAEDEAAITRAGARVGTLYYMAPELLKEGRLTPAADLYSLGVTLFQLLTGKVPFTGKTDYEIIEAHLKKEPPDIRTLNPEVPESLASCIHRALAKKPEERFSSAREFLEAIREIKTSRPTKERASAIPKGLLPEKLSRVSLPRGLTLRRKHLLVGLAALGILLLAVALFFWHQHRKARRVIIPAELPRVTFGGGGAPPPPQGHVIPLTGAGGPPSPPPPVFTPAQKKEAPSPGRPQKVLKPRAAPSREARALPKEISPERGETKKPSSAEKPASKAGGTGWVIRK